jgi:predicted DNA-binding ArsR family transcriptional regulator
MIYIIIALTLIIGVLGFTTIRLMKRVETMEDYVAEVEKSNDEYFKFFSQLKTRVTDSYSHLKNIDRLGSFESDDETGYIYKELKKIIEALKQGF